MPSLRKLVNFGSLPVGDVPRVVGTLATIEALSKFAPSNQVCDIAEVRLDEIGTETNWLEACRAIEGELIPTLLTLRSVTEGGKCSLGESEMIKVLESALSCVSAIDVEFKSRVARKVAKLAANAGKVALISYHDFSKTPDLHSLRDVIERASEYADVIKISTFVNSSEDLKTLRSLLEASASIPLCVIGMGPLGTSTRTSFPCIGSALTYGYVDIPSAPGQLPSFRLVEHLRLVLPKYNEEFVIRNKVLEFV